VLWAGRARFEKLACWNTIGSAKPVRKNLTSVNRSQTPSRDVCKTIAASSTERVTGKFGIDVSTSPSVGRRERLLRRIWPADLPLPFVSFRDPSVFASGEIRLKIINIHHAGKTGLPIA